MKTMMTDQQADSSRGPVQHPHPALNPAKRVAGSLSRNEVASDGDQYSSY